MLINTDSSQCLSIFHDAFANPLFIERLLLTIYSIIFLIGLVGNIMTIIIIKYNTHLRTPTNFYLLNLAVSDLMMLMCNLPLEMIEIYFRQWPLSIIFCKLRNICAEFFTCSSILTIFAFTCERYFSIVHPVHFHQLTHFRRAQNLIVGIWCISLLFSLPLGLSYEIEATVVEHFSLTRTNPKISEVNQTDLPTIVHCNSCVPKKSVAKLLSIVMIITSLCFFYIPMVIIGAIYLFIGQSLRRANKYEHQSEPIESNFSSLSSNGISAKKPFSTTPCQSAVLQPKELNNNKQSTHHVSSYSWLKTRARYQARQVVVKTLIAVVVAFFVCYAPLYLQRLLSAMISLNSNFSSESDLFAKTMAYLYVISGMTFYFGSVINPILYNLVSNKYRRAFRDLFSCRLTYKRKSSSKQKNSLFQRNRLQQASIHYFLTKPVQKIDRSVKRPIDPIPLTITKIKRPELSHNPSKSSSISSRQQANQPITSPIINESTKFSFRLTCFRTRRSTNTVPWLRAKDLT